MKKSIIAAAVIAGIVGLAGCTEEAKAAGATVFGAIDQRIEMTNGSWDVNGDTSDSYVGVSVAEDLGEGASAFATISMDYVTESDNSGNGQGVTQRDAFVGLTMDGITVQAGRMPNLTKQVIGGTVDAFEGTSFDANGAARADSVVAVSGEFGGVNVGVASVVDNGGEDKIDSYEATAGVTVAGVNVAGVYTKDKANDTDTKAVVASLDVAGFGLAGGYEVKSNDDVVMTAIASTTVGANTFRGGISDVENGVQTYIVEAEHAFSKSTKAYVNYSDNDTAGNDPTTMVGLKMTF